MIKTDCMEAERRHAYSMEETKESKTLLQENHAYHVRGHFSTIHQKETKTEQNRARPKQTETKNKRKNQ